jgi:hypothetical protein
VSPAGSCQCHHGHAQGVTEGQGHARAVRDPGRSVVVGGQPRNPSSSGLHRRRPTRVVRKWRLQQQGGAKPIEPGRPERYRQLGWRHVVIEP